MGLDLNFSKEITSKMNSSGKNTSGPCFLGQSRPSNGSLNREIEIKIGIVKRLICDLVSYKKELKMEEDIYLKREEEGEDEYVLRKQKQVIDECQRMIPDTERRLSEAVEKLSKDLADGRIDGDSSRISALINEASVLLEHRD
ncbi:hypothetical protein PNEG_01450 [Pneumocystis murina B123]|uniref:Tubulin-specific chaperone A n=1 Tax=Pneumocystis murina (strain B123) TaxID=1069680 RepID=M7NST5_PNEMU|nr:hypothetical protein PNEG_01450 [Pneumocystis murina B123]EMR10176.1 hypothetical protein PNEG_01450 [Pneumocystis murina B123]